MGSKGRLLIDLNEPPIDFEDDNDDVVCFQPQRAIPSASTPATNLFEASFFPHGIVNNHAFSHTSSVSGFQPFVKPKVDPRPEISAEKKSSEDMFSSFLSSSEAGNAQDVKAALNLESGSVHAQAIEKEEGEWSDVENGISVVREETNVPSDKQLLEKGTVEMMESNVPAFGTGTRSNPGVVKNEIGDPQSVETSDKKCHTDAQEEPVPVPKQREVRGIEVNHALKSTNNLGKRPKFDKHKEAMLGKKRSRQTMFLNLEEVKQVATLKSSTPKRKIPALNVTRAKQAQPMVRDTKQGDILASDGNKIPESTEYKSENNSYGSFRRLNSSTDVSSEGQAPPVPRQGPGKAPSDTRLVKDS